MHTSFCKPKTAKSRKVALSSKENNSAGFALFLVKSRPKHLGSQHATNEVIEEGELPMMVAVYLVIIILVFNLSL